MLDVVVLIPALDEEGSLPGVIAALPRAGPGWRVREVIVADNGSTDRTGEAARAAGARVVYAPRRGYGAACLAGLEALRAQPPDIVAFVDADHSDDPGELTAVLEPVVSERADLCVGSRVQARREPGAFSVAQAFGNWLAPALLRLLWGARVTDLGPFRAVRWSALERLAMLDRDYGWTVEMQARAFAQRLAYAEVPVSYRRRRAGRSKVSGTIRGVWGAGTKILATIARVRLGG